MSQERAFSLSDLVQDLQREAVPESSGVFTLDPSVAEEKLQNFALVEPEDYLLKLVQAGVALGASRIDIQSKPAAMEMLWHDASLQADDLPGLMGHLLSPQGSRHLRHLAAGLRGSVAVRPDYLLIESGQGERAFRRSWTDGSWNSQPIPGRSDEFTRLYLRRDLARILGKLSTSLRDFVNGRSTRNAEESALRSCSQFFPIPLTINGQTIEPSPFGSPRYPGYRIEDDEFPGESRAPAYVVQLEPSAYIEGRLHRNHLLIETAISGPGSLPALATRTASIRLPQAPRPPYCAWLALEAALNPQAQIYLVDDGLVIDRLSLDVGVPGVIAVLSVETLSKDLTGFQVVHNHAYEALLDWLQSQAQALRQQLLDRLEDIPVRDWVLEHCRAR